MFNNDRYLTKGVKAEIPLELQIFMWKCIDSLRGEGKELDYLQVFDLTSKYNDGKLVQEIKHSQEVPKYTRTYNVLPTMNVTAKIFVIDDGSHSTMLLADEY